jgi:hypothetical protein
LLRVSTLKQGIEEIPTVNDDICDIGVEFDQNCCIVVAALIVAARVIRCSDLISTGTDPRNALAGPSVRKVQRIGLAQLLETGLQVNRRQRPLATLPDSQTRGAHVRDYARYARRRDSNSPVQTHVALSSIEALPPQYRMDIVRAIEHQHWSILVPRRSLAVSELHA